MKLIVIYFSLIIFFLPASCLFCQEKNIGTPNITNYKKSDYRSGTQNWNIDQDKNGNMYFANNKGLLQFDGTTWRNYRIPNSLAVRSLKVDNETGRIYVGGYNEFGYFESDLNGNLIYVSLMDLIENVNFIKSDFTWKIHILNDEVVFQSFNVAYVYLNDKIKLLEAPNRFQFSYKIDNSIYFQDPSTGILEYKNGSLNLLEGTGFFNNSEIWGIIPIPSNKLLIATLEKGLFVYDNKKITSWNTESNDFISKNSSLGGVSINNELIVLNSVLNGIIICNLKGDIIQHLNIERGLQNNTILSSFIDRKNNLWLGLDNGISFVNINSPFTYFTTSDNLGTVYGSVLHKGYLYAATNQGVFCHLLKGSFLDNSFTLVEGTTAQSWNIQVIGNELVCANNRGALVIEGKKTIKVLDNIGYYTFKRIPNNPNFVIGSNYTGFALFEITSEGLVYKNKINGFDKSSTLFELDDSFLWLNKENLLYQMEISEDLKKFKSIRTITMLTPELQGTRSLQKINGHVYFQTNNQFYSYSKRQNIFIEEKELSKLFKNIPEINALIEDSHKNLWYTFNESLGVLMKGVTGSYKKHQATFSNLTGNLVNNYLSINTINPKNILIGSTNGLVNFDSQFSNKTSTKPRIFVRSFSFADNTIMQGNPQQKTQELKIPYKANHVKFTFSSPEFENTNNAIYTYQLEPFDNKWSQWTQTAIKEYTNLREGNYTMKVKTKNSYGIESNEEYFTFSVSPPWYRHYLAYMAYLIFLGLSIYFAYIIITARYRKREYYKTVEQRKIYLEKESKIRQEQYLMEKEIEKLNRDKLKTRILSKDKELVSNSLQVAKKNKILNDIIQKLKDMDKLSMNEETKFQFNKLKKSIIKEVNTDKSWKNLEKHIRNVHFDFLKRLKEKHPAISPRELDLSTCLLINMSTKEIVEVMNISIKGVELARYRLRKKLGLKRKQSLTGYLMGI